MLTNKFKLLEDIFTDAIAFYGSKDEDASKALKFFSANTLGS